MPTQQEYEPQKPLRPPPRYVNKARCVSAWHSYLVAYCGGEYPMLKTLSLASGIPKSTVHDYCVKMDLPLSQTRTRRR